jgi:drug/metabolite transporter (DMT)-like permease
LDRGRVSRSRYRSPAIAVELSTLHSAVDSKVQELLVEEEAAPVRVAARESRFGAYVAFAAICVIWGTTFAAIRVAIETIPTFLVAGVRFLVAALLLFVIARWRGARFPASRREWRDQVIAGLLMAGTANTLVVYAEHTLSSGLAALLAATIPIWMAALEALLGISSLTPKQVAGLGLGFGGVGLLVAPAIGHIELSWGFVVAVGAMQLNAILWNVGTLIARRHRTRTSPMAAAVVQMFSGGAAITILAFATGEHLTRGMFSIRSSVAVLYLAVLGSVVAYTAYNYAQAKLSARKVSSYAYVNPVIAVFTGALFLREPVTPRMIAAMAIIMGGVALIQIDRRKRA